MKIRDMERSAT